jgi:hypothetical protein
VLLEEEVRVEAGRHKGGDEGLLLFKSEERVGDRWTLEGGEGMSVGVVGVDARVSVGFHRVWQG